MTMCRLVVRTLEGEWQGEVDSWTSLVVLAALSAEPESFGEFVEAVRRYQPEHRLFDQPRQAAEDDEAEADGAWCLIDLAGRTLVAGAGFELPDRRGAYEASADDHAEGFPIVWLDTPADWLFRQADDDWQAVVAARASARSAVRRVDARAVLFGLPLLAHLADGVMSAVAHGAVDEKRTQELTRSLHAQWLLTARADLDGRTPREVLLAERDRLDWDLQHRSEQWSRQGYAVPPLPPESMAHRLGGFGTTEVVLYFDLVRALLDHASELTKQQPQPTQPALIEQLAECRDRWLQEPNEATGPLTPVALIASERRRLPVTSDGSHLDCDCPICQSLEEGNFGPAFLCFDGHHLELEDEFAFSMCATRAEWDREQENYRRFSEEMDRKFREQAAGDADAADPPAGSVWQASFVDWDSVAGPNSSPREALLSLGFPLAELTADLRNRPDGVNLTRSLNGAYRGLRASQDAVATDSASQEFHELLEGVCRKFPDLTAKCADLQSRLDEVLRGLS